MPSRLDTLLKGKDPSPSSTSPASDSLSLMLKALLEADTLEKAAGAALRPMLELAGRSLSGQGELGTGRIVRGMVHVRPEGGYRGLVVLEAGSKQVPTIPGDEDLRPSLTVWQHVEEKRCPLSVSVRTATLTPLGGAPIRLNRPTRQDVEVFASSARLLDRDATHLVVLPLRLGARAVSGMISLEASAPEAISRPLLPDDTLRALEQMAYLATPYLLDRPPAHEQNLAGDPLLPVVGRSMEGTLRLLRVFARQPETVLISGPTGAGKSRLARWCHASSPRASGPFEMVDLLTVPPEMQMAELFGWRKGAFTGALRDQEGCVGRASGGTLFLDEVDKLSLAAQAGLLTLIEERRYRVLGDGAARQADVRFLVGTNADLPALVREGLFREDLYYRINVLPVRLLPLRERRDELPEWARFMLERRHREAGQAISLHVMPDAIAPLLSFDWPGNLRQLDNVLRRAYALALLGSSLEEGLVIRRSDTAGALQYESAPGQSGPAVGGLPKLLRETARHYVLEAQRRQKEGQPMGLELAEAFSSYVLIEAEAATGGRRPACLLLGLEKVVEGRNHANLYRRALTRLRGALEAIGEDPEPQLERMLGTGDGTDA